MRIKERRVLSGNQNVAFAKHVKSPTAGHAIDCCDDGLPEVIGLWAKQLAWVIKVEGCGTKARDAVSFMIGYCPSPAFAVVDLLRAVNASAKGSVAGGSEHNAAHLVLMTHAPPEMMQLVHHL